MIQEDFELLHMIKKHIALTDYRTPFMREV